MSNLFRANYKDFYSHLFLESVNEALSFKNIKKYKPTRKNSGAYNEKLNGVFKGKDRLVFDIEISQKEIKSDHVLYQKIKDKLKEAGFFLEDFNGYINGVCYRIKKDIVDKKNPTTIGRALTAIGEKELLKSFINDPLRTEEITKRRRGSFYKVVISRHPYDLYGMSTDRNWTSCMRLAQTGGEYGKNTDSGINKHFISNDVRFGTLVAYLTTQEDIDGSTGKVKLRRPLTRLLMKPFENSSGKIAYGIGRMYGNSFEEFKTFVEEWIKKNLNFDVKPTDEFSMVSGLYGDGDKMVGAKTSDGKNARLRRVLDDHYYFDETHNKYMNNVDIDVVYGHGNNDYAEMYMRFNIDEVKTYSFTDYQIYRDSVIQVDYKDLSQDLKKILNQRHGKMHINTINNIVTLEDQSEPYHDEERGGKFWNNDMEEDYIAGHLDGLKLIKSFEKLGYPKLKELVKKFIPEYFEKYVNDHKDRIKKIELSKSEIQKKLEELNVTESLLPLYKKIKNKKDLGLFLAMNEIALKTFKETQDLEEYKTNIRELVLSRFDIDDLQKIKFLLMVLKYNTGDQLLVNIMTPEQKQLVPYENLRPLVEKLSSEIIKDADKTYDLGILDNFNGTDFYTPQSIYVKIPSSEEDIREVLNVVRLARELKKMVK